MGMLESSRSLAIFDSSVSPEYFGIELKITPLIFFGTIVEAALSFSLIVVIESDVSNLIIIIMLLSGISNKNSAIY